MMKQVAMVAFIAVLTSLTLPSMAEKAGGPCKHHQKARIEQGIKSGSLTRHEVKQLATQHKKIQEKAVEYRSDGKLTPRERLDLKTDHLQLNREIYRQKHDNQNRR